VLAELGLFRLQGELDRDVVERLPASCRGPLHFFLAMEVSTAFHRDGQARRMHHLLPGVQRSLPSHPDTATMPSALLHLGRFLVPFRGAAGVLQAHPAWLG
jgi:hypothetical protein